MMDLMNELAEPLLDFNSKGATSEHDNQMQPLAQKGKVPIREESK